MLLFFCLTMSFELWEVGAFIVCIIFVIGVFFLFFHKGQKLSEENFEKYSQKILNTTYLDPAHAVMESHKIFVAAISTFCTEKRLTSAKKIARYAKSFPNERKIWQLHRLRNELAHEVEVEVLQTQAEIARREFVRALKSLV